MSPKKRCEVDNSEFDENFIETLSEQEVIIPNKREAKIREEVEAFLEDYRYFLLVLGIYGGLSTLRKNLNPLKKEATRYLKIIKEVTDAITNRNRLEESNLHQPKKKPRKGGK